MTNHGVESYRITVELNLIYKMPKLTSDNTQCRIMSYESLNVIE